jgi:O-acetylserine/cysteine efflux transporter
MRVKDIALACCPPALWGISYALAKPATNHFPPIFMMSMVYAVTAVVLFRSSRKFRTPYLHLILIAALGGAIQSSLIFKGMSGLPASTAILAVQAQVPFAVLSAWLIGKERLQPRRLMGIAVSATGILIIAGTPEAWGNLGSLALVLLGALSWGLSQGLARRLGRDSGSALTAAIMAYAAPQMLIASFILESGQIAALQTASWQDWTAILILAIGGFAIAYSIWYSLLQRHRIDQVAPFALLMPFIGVLMSVLTLGERLSSGALIGGATIILGLAIIVIERKAHAS